MGMVSRDPSSVAIRRLCHEQCFPSRRPRYESKAVTRQAVAEQLPRNNQRAALAGWRGGPDRRPGRCDCRHRAQGVGATTKAVNASVHVVAHSSAVAALWIKPTQQADQVARLDQIGVEPRCLGLGPLVGLVIGGIGNESDAGTGSSTQTAGHAESIATGQAQINDGHVVWTGNAKANALRAGSRCVDLMAKPRQQETKRLAAVGIIFDDQHAAWTRACLL